MKYLFGIKPTGNLHLGHLNCLSGYKKEDVIILVANVHASISNNSNSTYNLICQFISLGYKKENIILQSMLKGLFSFSFFLSNFISDAKLKRMHLYKKKTEKKERIYVSEYLYPILMSADILFLNIKNIIVGHDQLQHIELCNDILDNLPFEIKSLYSPFSGVYKDYFTQGIDGRKMSKSYNNTISFFDDITETRKKINKIKTENITKSSNINKDNTLLNICYSIQEDKFINKINYCIDNKLGFKHIKDVLLEFVISKKKILKKIKKENLDKQLKINCEKINLRNKKIPYKNYIK